MPTRKSTPVIVIGVAVFVVGAALAFLLLRNNNSSKKKTAGKVAAASPITTQPANAVVVPSAGGSQAPSFNFQIPPGDNAVAVSVPQLQGVDGFVKAGDLVNIYSNITKSRLASLPGLTQPETKLVLSNIQVLAVLGSGPSATPTGSTVFVLALDPIQAEQIIFFTSNESLYFTLVPKGNSPAITPGRAYQNAA